MQAQSARDATAAQERMFERQVQLQEPWRRTGEQGLNRLSFLLGLSDPKATAAAAPTGETSQQIRERLTPQFNKPHTFTFRKRQFSVPNVDEAGLEAAVTAEIQRQALQAAQPPAAPDPQFGSLLKDFSRADFEADPGYAFRQEEGMRGLERSAAARGGLFSGRAMKDTLRFGQGLAAQEYGSAFDRFNVGQANKFNRLASIAGIGQTAANQTGAAARTFGSQVGENIIGAGNARAAGQVGSANAWNNAIGQGVSAYQNHLMMNRMQQPQYRYTVPTYDGAEY